MFPETKKQQSSRSDNKQSMFEVDRSIIEIDTANY